MENYTVYVHNFPNGKSYVGITKMKVEDRWQIDGVGYKRQPVYAAITKFGWNNIEHLIIEDNLSREEASEKEKELIETLDSINNGYNVSKGGGCGGDAWVEFEYNGIMMSARELEEISVEGVTSHDITTRVNFRGWSLERALTQPKQDRVYSYEYNGKYYTTEELYNMKTIEIERRPFLDRLRRGWSIDRVLHQPTGVKKQPFGITERDYIYKGKKYNSYELSQMSKVPGITSTHIYNRIKIHGWDIERAITQPLKKRNN